VWASILHPENEPFLRYLRREITGAAVDVHVGHPATAEDITRLAPEAVIVASGGRVQVPSIPGAHLRHVSTGPRLRGLGNQFLTGWRAALARPRAVRAATRAWLPLGKRVVIVGGDLVALELAEFLAARGRFVTVLEAGNILAPEIGNKRKTEHMDRLDRLGVSVHVLAPVERITPDGLVFRPHGGSARSLAADNVVLAGTLEADTSLYDALTASLPEVKVSAAGDCTGLGLIRKATEDGARAACAI
jgi:2,4-dienoyl-CoA reductase (NADPH2)